MNSETQTRPTCGSRVNVVGSGEGTNYHVPVSLVYAVVNGNYFPRQVKDVFAKKERADKEAGMLGSPYNVVLMEVRQ